MKKLRHQHFSCTISCTLRLTTYGKVISNLQTFFESTINSQTLFNDESKTNIVNWLWIVFEEKNQTLWVFLALKNISLLSIIFSTEEKKAISNISIGKKDERKLDRFTHITHNFKIRTLWTRGMEIPGGQKKFHRFHWYEFCCQKTGPIFKLDFVS